MIIGTVPYLNALPLISSLPQTATLVTLTPTELISAVLKGRLTAGLLPSYSILEHGLKSYPEAGLIGCDGAVKSVGFFTRNHIKKLNDIDTIYFDQESQTSVRLAQIVLHKVFKRNLKSIRTVSLHDSHRADALMLIGDKALFFREDGYRYWDLGETWKSLTGLGFVFASWASLKPLSKNVVKMLTDARNTGFQNLPNWLQNPQNSRDELALHYLKNNIVYDLTPSLKKGQAQYHDYLKELDLCQMAFKRRVA